MLEMVTFVDETNSISVPAWVVNLESFRRRHYPHLVTQPAPKPGDDGDVVSTALTQRENALAKHHSIQRR